MKPREIVCLVAWAAAPVLGATLPDACVLLALTCHTICSALILAIEVSLAEVASFDLTGAAVATFVNAPSGFGPDPSSCALLATTFSPTADHDNILLVSNLAAPLKKLGEQAAAGTVGDGASNNLTITVVDGDAVWPNQADPVAAGVVVAASGEEVETTAILGAGGFFVNVPGLIFLEVR